MKLGISLLSAPRPLYWARNQGFLADFCVKNIMKNHVNWPEWPFEISAPTQSIFANVCVFNIFLARSLDSCIDFFENSGVILHNLTNYLRENR